MNDNDCFVKIIEMMIKQAKNKEYIKNLKFMVSKIKGKKYIEERHHPRFLSIQFGYNNLFPLKDEHYRLMAETLDKRQFLE